MYFNIKSKIIIFIIVHLAFAPSFGQVNNSADTLTPDNAIRYYNSILKKNSSSPFAYFGLASAYFLKLDYHASLKYSKRNLKKANDYRADSYIIYGSSLDRLGRTPEAIEIFEDALKLYPDNYQLNYQYALSCYKYRSLDKAIPAVKKVIKQQPLFVPAHYLYGCALFENYNDRNCISAFLFALLLDNDSLRTRQAVAFVNEYFKHNLENINIPFFENRLVILTVDNILYYYISRKTKDEIFSGLNFEYLVSSIQDYLKSAKQTLPEYQNFYSSLTAQNFSGAFSFYILRITGNNFITNWYINHKDTLGQFAGFLDKNLPGK